jgi:glycine/D-amino acid oxidase-like deaminating enzyme
MKFDYIIIGAGVIGCTSAFYLKKFDPSLNILLLDKNNRPGAGNTAKSAALYRNIFSSPSSWLLASGSIHYYQQLGDQIQINPHGYLWLFSDDQWKGSVLARRRLQQDRDGIEFLSDEAIKEKLAVNSVGKDCYPGIDHGILGHRCGSLSGMALAEHYFNEFVELGGNVRLNTQITHFRLTGAQSGYAPWKNIKVLEAVDSLGNGYRSSHIISAVGAWTHGLLSPLGIAASVLPKKRQLFGLRLKDPRQITGTTAAGRVPAIILPAGGVYIKPVFSRSFMIVGCAENLGQPYNMSDPSPDPMYFRNAIEPVLNHYFPMLKDYDLVTKWAGYYAYHWPDKNPVVETEKNITWVSGTSGSGIMKADSLGRVTAAHVLGMKHVELADGTTFPVSSLSLRQRDVENEEMII